MTISICWDNEAHNVLRMTHNGAWNFQELNEAVETGWQMVNTVAHPVDIIHEFQPGVQLPSNLISGFYRMMRQPVHPNLSGLIVFVGVTKVGRNLLLIMRRMYPSPRLNHVYFVDTLDEARHFIAQQQEQRHRRHLRRQHEQEIAEH